MPSYISSHTIACMTRQGLAQLVKDMQAAATDDIRLVRLRGNLIEGKIIGEFEAPTREALAEWLKKSKVHFDWLIRVEVEALAAV